MESLHDAKVSISVVDVQNPTLAEQIATAKQNYLASAIDKYTQYANVFVTSIQSIILQALESGQANDSYSCNIFEYSSIPESRAFSEPEKNNCPQSFYDEIVKYFASQNVTCVITQTPPNTITFTL